MLELKKLSTWMGLAPAFAVLLAVQASAQDAFREAEALGEAPQVAEEVIVRGRRLSEIEFNLQRYIHDFLDEVTAPARGRGLARWQRRVCVGVHNVQNTAAQYIADRIASVMLGVGLQPGEPGCTPDVSIIFSTDASQSAAQMVDSDPRLFRPVAGYAGTDLGLEALDEFVRTDRAVRWWHVSLPVDARTGVPAIELPDGGLCGGARCTPQIAVAGPSRIHSGIRDDLRYVIMIVDVTKLTGMTWQALADYLALVSLAQIDPKTNPASFDSILNLFSNPGAYSGLTDWDWSYLRALYAFDQERVPSAQRNEIVSRIAQQERVAGE
jgi:hypothetical protein